jgi:hypothetical protein
MSNMAEFRALRREERGESRGRGVEVWNEKE